MPFGNDYFSKQNEANIKNACEFFKNKNVSLSGLDFEECLNLFLSNKHSFKLGKEDFVYIDSPYSITNAVYNEKKGWSKDDDERLFRCCEELNKRGINFAMSNVLFNRGVYNEVLDEFVRKNNLNLLCLKDEFKYTPCGRGTKEKTKEVFVCNYEVCNEDNFLSNSFFKEFKNSNSCLRDLFSVSSL